MAENTIEPGYYKPDPEDFHLGYEYEFHCMTTGGYFFMDRDENTPPDRMPDHKVWSKEVITDHMLYGRSLTDALKILKGDRIRTQYLTREQIEAQGWTFKGKSVDTWFEKTGSFEQSSWRSHTAVLHYGFHDQRLTVYLMDGPDETPIYLGECKSINEFKLIEKWLKIQ